MWAGVIANELVYFSHLLTFLSLPLLSFLLDLYMLPERLAGRSYRNFLQTTLPTALEDEPLAGRHNTWFMHDGKPVRSDCTACYCLDEVSPECWMVGHGPVSWPSRSPYLNSIDFILWGSLKILFMLPKYSHLRTYGNALTMHLNVSVLSRTRVFKKTCRNLHHS